MDRTSAQDTVAQVVAQFQQREQFVLGLAPEGKRKKVSTKKTNIRDTEKNPGLFD